MLLLTNRWCLVFGVSVLEMAQCAQSTAVQYSSSSPFKSTCATWRGIYTWALPPAYLRTERVPKCCCSGYCRQESHACSWPYHTEVCLSAYIFHWSQEVVLSFHKLIRYIRMHTVETGNEFSISDDEKTDNYELNVARHAFSCSMRSVSLLQYSCMTNMPWLYKSSLTNPFCSCC